LLLDTCPFSGSQGRCAVGTAREAGQRTANPTEDLTEAIRERPFTALAIAAGIALAVGTLWRSQQRWPNRLDALPRQLAELSGRDSLTPTRWRSHH
jgi:hypothetical protein